MHHFQGIVKDCAISGKGSYIFEFMRISREITPFNTIGHIGGVHYVAIFVGKQFTGTDIPIDMALLSGAAAAGHDLGKFGCSPQEASGYRISIITIRMSCLEEKTCR